MRKKSKTSKGPGFGTRLHAIVKLVVTAGAAFTMLAFAGQAPKTADDAYPSASPTFDRRRNFSFRTALLPTKSIIWKPWAPAWPGWTTVGRAHGPVFFNRPPPIFTSHPASAQRALSTTAATELLPTSPKGWCGRRETLWPGLRLEISTATYPDVTGYGSAILYHNNAMELYRRHHKAG